MEDLTLQVFLDASSQLYKRVCPSVRPSVRPLVRNASVKIAENCVMQDEDASYAEVHVLVPFKMRPRISTRGCVRQSVLNRGVHRGSLMEYPPKTRDSSSSLSP